MIAPSQLQANLASLQLLAAEYATKLFALVVIAKHLPLLVDAVAIQGFLWLDTYRRLLFLPVAEAAIVFFP
ncbi:hypothetical protein AWM79_19500 [Pseudomonas agarici]|uniref:Uncharacterized protein n=1 Tax=Pseudomonas agarici TaxID=46677 RepID=A0A0X1T5I4_PSEAA|nr:hypothetical protein AWM79_19500 [Pseudomonas agarici]